MPFTPSPAVVRHPHHHIFVKAEGDLRGEGWGEGEERHIVPLPFSPPARGGEFFGGIF